MTAQPTRDQLRALANAATPGPWEVHGSLIGIGRAKPDFGQTWGLRWRQDIEFICAARTAVPQLLDQLAQEEKDCGYWQARAYEAEGKLWKAEARIRAVQDALDQADEMGEWAITCTRLQWAVDGSAPHPGA